MNVASHEKPHKPIALQIFHALHNRKDFSSSELRLYHNAKKGYDGELRFCTFLQKTIPKSLPLLHSLTLNSNNSNFQIDSLLVNNDSIYLFEVKNFSGDFYIRSNNWYVRTGDKEINNPFIQLKRSASLLRQLLSSRNITYPIKPFVVFINPEFLLYGASMNLPMIIHPQLGRFFNSDFFQTLPASRADHEVARLLVREHWEDVRDENLPVYTFAELRKGVRCLECRRFMRVRSQYVLICPVCQVEEKSDTTVMRSIQEFMLLFPTEKITTGIIKEWCEVLSERTVRRVLSKNLKRRGNGRTTHYTI